MSLARRVALVDLDWTDTDAILRAVRDDRVEVRLVLGASEDDAGVRVADLLGVPHSTEVGDLTRELFDVAVIGDASPRRAALERLLGALGTPVLGPSRFPDATDAALTGVTGDDSADAARDRALDPRGDSVTSGAASDPWSMFETDAAGVAPAPEPSPAPVEGDASAAPATGARTVDGETFTHCVAQALDRHRQGEAAYVLHRVRVPSGGDGATALAASLPAVFRGTDVVCRADDRTWVLLCAGASADPGRVERRLRRAWRRAHPEGPAIPALRHESVALSTAEDTRPFAAAARAWLGAR